MEAVSKGRRRRFHKTHVEKERNGRDKGCVPLRKGVATVPIEIFTAGVAGPPFTNGEWIAALTRRCRRSLTLVQVNLFIGATQEMRAEAERSVHMNAQD
jgi:hypothetical protein